MFDRLDDLLIRYEELMEELGSPEVASDTNRFRKLMKEQSDLAPIVEAYKEYKKAKQDVEDSLALLDEESDEEIHQRTRTHDEHAARQLRLAEGVLIFTFTVLALHDARAAERQQLQAVHRAMIFVLENGRAHADPEFIDLHAAALGGDKMAEFMHDDQHAEGQNGQND